MPSRILLVRTDRIGDTLLTLPAVTALRQTFPDAFIAFLCQPYTEPMVRRINGLDQVLTYENEGKHQGFQGLELLSKELRSYQFDFSVVFFPRASLIWALWRSGIPRRIGTGFRWYSFLFLALKRNPNPSVLPQIKSCHLVLQGSREIGRNTKASVMSFGKS